MAQTQTPSNTSHLIKRSALTAKHQQSDRVLLPCNWITFRYADKQRLCAWLYGLGHQYGVERLC